jgi:hypothetical protein
VLQPRGVDDVQLRISEQRQIVAERAQGAVGIVDHFVGREFLGVRLGPDLDQVVAVVTQVLEGRKEILRRNLHSRIAGILAEVDRRHLLDPASQQFGQRPVDRRQACGCTAPGSLDTSLI